MSAAAFTAADYTTWDIGRSSVRDGVDVLTSWLPVQGRFETLVEAGWDDLTAAARPGELAYPETWQWQTADAARDGHAGIVRYLNSKLPLEPGQ